MFNYTPFESRKLNDSFNVQDILNMYQQSRIDMIPGIKLQTEN